MRLPANQIDGRVSHPEPTVLVLPSGSFSSQPVIGHRKAELLTPAASDEATARSQRPLRTLDACLRAITRILRVQSLLPEPEFSPMRDFDGGVSTGGEAEVKSYQIEIYTVQTRVPEPWKLYNGCHVSRVNA